MNRALIADPPPGWPFPIGRRWLLLILLLLLPSLVDAQEQRKLRHILLASETITDSLMVAIEGGSDFRSLARRYSLDVGTRILGGDLDWVSRGSVEPEFAAAAFAIEKPGGIAKCKTRYGWHLIEFLETRGTPLEQPPAKPATGTTGNGKPVSPVPVQGVRNEDLTVTLKVPKMAQTSGEPAIALMEISNNTTEPKQVFNPVLWPLGLIVRYQFGVLNVSLDPPFEGEPEGGLLKTIAGGETLSHTFDINEYADGRGDWPHIRTIWRGDTFFSRVEKRFPQITETAGYADWKSRWRFYASGEQHHNVLPAYSPDERWFLCLFARGQIWIELEDPGIPGVIENLIDQVRNEGFTDIKTSKFVDGHSLQVRVPLASDAVPWQPSRVTSDWQRGSVGITRDLASGGAKIGSSLFLALGDVSDRKGALTPVGRILDLSESSLVRVEEALRGGGVQQVNLVLAYPESLIPSVVRQEIDGRKSNPSETPAETGAAEKGTGTPASSASSSREQQEEAPSQLILRLDGASGDWERVVEGRATAIADLPSYLKKMVELKKLEASGGSAAPFSVILEVPGGVPTSNMKMVVKMLQSLGIQDLSFRNSDTATPVARIDPVTGKLNQPKLQGIKPREFAEPISKARPVESSLITPDPNAEPLPRVRVKTNRGTFVIELYEDDAPNTVANFIHLVESGFYVGQIFNRKSSNPSNKGFIQGGSPDGTRKGGPGYMIMDELNNRRNIKGAVAMARKHTVPNTAGSQFFICLDNQPQLDGIYTVFAVVVEGFKWVETFEVGTVLEDLQVIGKRDHEYTPRTNPL